MDCSKNGAPMFDGQNYAFWSIKMRAFLQGLGAEAWHSVMNGYTVPTAIPTDNASKKLYESNGKAVSAILGSLADSVFVKVMHCNSAKEIWDKLKTIYEGDKKVKEAKLQTYRGHFEQLKMKESEDIAAYFLRVDEVVNAMRGLGEKMEDQTVVRKILRSLAKRFDPKVSALEERVDLATMSMDELHGILTAYEMRMEQDNPSSKEAAFKVSKKTKKNKQK